MKKQSKPRIEPWCTPVFKSKAEKQKPAKETETIQALRSEKNPGNFGVTGNQEKLCISRREWSAVLNTAGKSSGIRTEK